MDDQSHNPGISGLRSNQLSYPARDASENFFKNEFMLSPVIYLGSIIYGWANHQMPEIRSKSESELCF